MNIINKNGKRSFGPGMRIPRLVPPAQPDWYKRFRQLASRADKRFKIKSLR